MTSTAIFEPIGHESLADAVVAQIEDLIASGILKQGRKLPSERELAEKMHVSRPKLREALHTLEERGLVTTLHGEGTFVAPLISQAMMPALLTLYERHEPAFFDYLEYRREQEGFAARLAARRATSADRKRITDILTEDARAWRDNDITASHEADFALHAAIVDASQNATMIHMMTSIHELTRQGVFFNRGFLQAIEGTDKHIKAQHEELGKAVIAGDEDRAVEAAHAHIDFVTTSFRMSIKQRRREAMAEKRRLLSDLPTSNKSGSKRGAPLRRSPGLP